MKKLINILLAGLLVMFCGAAFAQEEEQPAKPELMLNLRYFNVNGKLQYLQAKTMIKADNKMQAAPNVAVGIYLDEALPENLIGQVKTNDKGEASTAIPVSLKDKWNASTTHKFIAVAPATKQLEEVTTELEIAKARILIDTLFEDDVRKITVQVMTFQDSMWVPAPDVELKIGVRRLGGDLNVGEDETYTTDSLGQAVAEFKREKLPADDAKNNIVLVAKMEDNDLFGNVSVDKMVPWGTYQKFTSNFEERSLWGTRDKVPYWLLFLALGIIGSVWGVIIYLVFQIIRIKKEGGKQTPPREPVITPIGSEKAKLEA